MYKRILIKLSGEALIDNNHNNISLNSIKHICEEIKQVYEKGYQICIVIGGGNICRGTSIAEIGIERVSGDYMGMLATVINGIALQSILEKENISTRLQSAIPMMTIAEPYIRRKAIRHMEKQRIVIFSGGTGNPFVTTDTCASLRAAKTNCDLIIKATHVDGVYSADPHKEKGAIKYQKLSYSEVLNQELAIMDSSAISLAKDNKIPIIVFNLHKKGELLKVINHQGDYSIIN